MRFATSSLGNVPVRQYLLRRRNSGAGLKVRPAAQGSPQAMPSICLERMLQEGRPMVRSTRGL
jgi:hypothetical protein